MTMLEPRSAVDARIVDTALASEIEFLAVKAFAEGTRRVNARLSAVGLRARSYSVLALAASGVELAQRDLSVLLELDPSQIVALVDELEAAGLVERVGSLADRRAKVVRATRAGHETFAQARLLTAAAEDDALSMLSGVERDLLRALLRKITFSDGPSEQAPVGDTTLLYLIKQVELAVRAHLDDAVSAVDLTALQYTALTVLERHPGITSAQLARNSFVRPQTMAQMVTSLEKLGYIERSRDPESQRQLRISLTPSGVRILAQLRRPVAELESDMVSDLDEAQVVSLRLALHSCRVALARRLR
jgi:DNA-binding MarR family transcriptional regulator